MHEMSQVSPSPEHCQASQTPSCNRLLPLPPPCQPRCEANEGTCYCYLVLWHTGMLSDCDLYSMLARSRTRIRRDLSSTSTSGAWATSCSARLGRAEHDEASFLAPAIVHPISFAGQVVEL